MGTGDEGDSDVAEESLSLDAILDALSHHQRRTLLRWIREQPDQRAATSDVMKHLIDQEGKRTGHTPSPDHVELSLLHMHVPKLSNIGLLTYDEEAKEYTYHPNERFTKWLDLIVSEHESEW